MRNFDRRFAQSELVSRDLLVSLAILILLALGGSSIGLYETVHHFARAHESLGLGELFSALMVMSVGLLALSLRRAHRLRQEVERREAAERQANILARHDPLTGLPNRRVLSEWLERSRKETIERGTELTVLLIDLDRFKPVNDIYGHAAGDAVLTAMTDRISTLSERMGDVMVARLGGDEFACVIEHASRSDLPIRLAKQIVTAGRQPILIGPSSVEVGASVGIATCADGSLNAEDLLRAADIAMYRAKRDGRSTFRSFEASMDAELQDRAALEAELRKAIADGQIVPHYQPINRLPGMELVGFEALARWHHPTRGAIEPDVFIPVAEDGGWINDLTFSLLRQACKDSVHWPPHLVLSLNISPIQLKDRWLPARLLKILAEGRLAPGRLIVEITENGLVSDFAAAREIIGSLKNAGVQVALDDFGTGYSSLSHLRELQFDRLKIDRSFVQNMGDVDSGKLVKAIIGLGVSLGIEVTAEGIETEASLAMLSEFGCDFAQGYLVGRPASAEEASRHFTPESRPALSAPAQRRQSGR